MASVRKRMGEYPLRETSLGFCAAAALAVSSLAIPSHAVLQVKGRFLYDGCGEKIVIRGVESMTFPHDPEGLNVAEMGKSNSNTVRHLFDVSMSPSQVESVIKKTVDAKMIANVGIWKAYSNRSWFTSPAIMAILKKYEDHIIIHAVGESEYEDKENPGRWDADAKAVIKMMRDAGYKAPLDILSTTFGRDPRPVLDRGQSIIDADPLHNIIFGVQMYWGDWYTGLYGMSIEQATAKMATLGFPVQLGACPADCGNDCWRQVWKSTYLHEVGALWWSWRGDQFALTDNSSPGGIFGNWNENYGSEIVVDGPYALMKTAKKTDWMRTGVCSANGIASPELSRRKSTVPVSSGRAFDGLGRSAFEVKLGLGGYPTGMTLIRSKENSLPKVAPR